MSQQLKVWTLLVFGIAVCALKNPQNFDSNWQLAGKLAEAGQYEEAIKHVSICLRIRPQDDVAWDEYARLRAALRSKEQSHQESTAVPVLQDRDATSGAPSSQVAVVPQPQEKEQQKQMEDSAESPSSTRTTPPRAAADAVNTADDDPKAAPPKPIKWVAPQVIFDLPSPAGYKEVFADQLCPCHNAARSISAAYQDIFSHISIKRGWRTLPFTLPDVERLLSVAAEIVAFLRTYLDAKTEGFKLRQVDGSAQEFLWQVTKNPRMDLPQQNYTYVYEVLHGVVHATLKDAHGYVEGVDQSMVSQFVDAHPFVDGVLRPAATK